MKCIRVLYCIPALSNPGGMERIITEKINYLVNTGKFEVYIVTTEIDSEESFFPLCAEVKIINLKINFNEIFLSPLVLKFVTFKKKLKLYKIELSKLLFDLQIDICISTGGKELEFLSNLRIPCAKVLELHFAQEIRKQFLLARRDNVGYRILGCIRTKQLIWQSQKLDAVVVLTKADETEWKKTNSNIFQIYNFSSIDNNLERVSENKVAIAIGRLDAQKGFDMLIDAWAQQKDKLGDWTLKIFGKGEWYGMLSEKISDYGLKNQVFLQDVTDNVKLQLSQSSIFIFSSRYEGFGLVLIEAMQMNVPIVSFDCPNGPSELIEHKKSGLLVEAENTLQLGEAIVTMAESDELRQTYAKNGRIKVTEFSKEKIMKQWISLFNSLVNR